MSMLMTTPITYVASSSPMTTMRAHRYLYVSTRVLRNKHSFLLPLIRCNGHVSCRYLSTIEAQSNQTRDIVFPINHKKCFMWDPHKVRFI